MLLVDANRQCLQKLLTNYPEVCSALHLTEPYWEENVMVLRTDDPNISKILSRYFQSEFVQNKLLAAIPVEKFIIETISMPVVPELTQGQFIFGNEPKYENYNSSSLTKNFFLGIESGLCEEEMESDMTIAMLEAVEAFVATEDKAIEVSTIGDLVKYLSLMFNCSPEIASKHIFEVKLTRSMITHMTASFMQNRAAAFATSKNWEQNGKVKNLSIEAKSSNGSAVVENQGAMPSPDEDMQSMEHSVNADAVSQTLNNKPENVISKFPKKSIEEKDLSPKPSKILKEQNLPTRYRVFQDTVPPKPTMRRTPKTIDTDDANTKAYLKAGVERMTGDKAGQFYVLKAIAEGSSPAATEIYYPQIINAYAKVYKAFQNPEKQAAQIERIKEAASALLSQMTVPESQESEIYQNGESNSKLVYMPEETE